MSARRDSGVVHTPECIERARRGLGGCWCALIASKKKSK